MCRYGSVASGPRSSACVTQPIVNIIAGNAFCGATAFRPSAKSQATSRYTGPRICRTSLDQATVAPRASSPRSSTLYNNPVMIMDVVAAALITVNRRASGCALRARTAAPIRKMIAVSTFESIVN